MCNHWSESMTHQTGNGDGFEDGMEKAPLVTADTRK